MRSYQTLSSLVLNPPYKIDGFTTSPKVSKTLSFPFGIRVDSSLVIRSFFQFFYLMFFFMIIGSICLLSFYLPIQLTNNQMLSKATSLSNQNLALLAQLQETSNFNKLFLSASNLSLKDTEEVIKVSDTNNYSDNQITKNITFNKYPSIQFTGF